MALPTLQAVAGLIVALYLLTFVVFAVLRIFTGISIQRLGLTSLRHIAYGPRDGLRVEVRGLGIQVHRPTFAQPTWISIVVEELKVIVDLRALGVAQAKHEIGDANGSTDTDARQKLRTRLASASSTSSSSNKKGGKFWANLISIKNKVKRLHRIISWLRLIDIHALRSACVIVDVGTVQVGAVLLTVDTRLSTVDRSKLFQHNKAQRGEHYPAEWRLAVRNILFTPQDKDCIEIVDHVILNVHGYLRQQTEGLRDASVSLKIGRLHLPLDDFRIAKQSLRAVERERKDFAGESNQEHRQDSNKEQKNMPQVLSDARDFVGSTLRGIREVSFAVGFVGFSERIDSVRPAGAPLYMNASMKEIGMDLYRLDPTTAEHSMYFARHEVAHQALLTVLSASVGMDSGDANPQRLMYLPMTTATIRTTLPSKLLQFSSESGVLDLNSNVFFSNIVVTSPSIDLDPAHLPILLAALQRRTTSQKTSSPGLSTRLASRLLPRAVVKFSVHEPVMRVALPPVESRKADDYDFDLLISAISSVSFDLDSAHNSAEDVKYNASLSVRLASHRLYYQTTSRETHELFFSESMTLKAQVTSDPQVLVVANANLQTLSLFLVRPEITEAIRQIVHQLRSDVKVDKHPRPKSVKSPNMLRSIPHWLHHVDLQATDLNLEIAGVDKKLSSISRGFALHLDSVSTEYKAHKDDEGKKQPLRRRGGSQSKRNEGDSPRPQSPTSKARQRAAGLPTDGRRVAVHFKGLESYVIESASNWENDPFLSVPKAEVAFTTLNDGEGSVLHINSHVRSIYIQYSLFRHYAVGVGIWTLQNTLSRSRSSMAETAKDSSKQSLTATTGMSPNQDAQDASEEILAVDVRVSYVQVKAQLPDDPATMIQLAGVETARHRWHTPFIRSQVVRFFARTPGVKNTWSRIVSIKSPRLDIRQNRRKQGANHVVEQSFDIVSDAVRMAVPSQLVVHKIFDNFVNTAKTVAQLHHRFKTGSDEYILQKVPEEPKQVPRINIRTQTFIFEIEDAPFEWKLGSIFRTGLIEQKQRIAREEAFHVKCKTLEQESKQQSSRLQSTSHPSLPRGRTRSQSQKRPNKLHRTKTGRERERSRPGSMTRGRSLRYDTEGAHTLSAFAQTNRTEAWERLQRYNAQSWKKRIDQSLSDQRGSMDELYDLFWGSEELPDDAGTQERIMQLPRRPPLAAVMMNGLTITIDKPTFPLDDLREFMHRTGKGLPLDTKFGLLVPLNAQIDAGEIRVTLRDYPLPALHIPPLRARQSPKLTSVSLKANFVIAEEFRDHESTRDLSIEVVPASKMKGDSRKSGGFAVDVRRTVSPVKTYSDINLDIHTSRDTRITWGTSYQPAIQHTMQVIEGFTKPQVDPSEKVGFWDKIRLSFHSRLNVNWMGGGDVHLTLKGSRDPYIVTGHGAGFMLIWRNSVRWRIHNDNDPCNFMVVDSGDFVLAVPDFSKYARRAPGQPAQRSASGDRAAPADDAQLLKKVIMKLSGKVRWKVGLVFERDVSGDGRSFDFKPHYDVVLKNPAHAKGIQQQGSYDAFTGFRSNHIHMSVGVSAPSDREWSVNNLASASNYNTVHLSPRFFTHFFAWWAMFSGIMSLPVHQGKLFPSTEKSGKKFGRHLATIKYSLLFSPLFISHVYLHKDGDEYAEDVVSATGLKMRLDSFMLDVHQRREEFLSGAKGYNSIKTTSMRINQALLDLVKADLRAVSVGISGTSMESVRRANPEQLLELQQNSRPVGLSHFNIPDSDFTWVDMDDFVEIDWALPHGHEPKTSILPLGYSPRFTYRRQTDHGNTVSGDPNRQSPFGYETTHECIMSASNDSRRVQMQLVKDRLSSIDGLLEDHNRAIGDQEVHAVREVDNVDEIKHELNELREHGLIFQRKKAFLSQMMKDLQKRIEHDEAKTKARSTNGQPGHPHEGPFGDPETDDPAENDPHFDEPKGNLADHVSDFNNRFIVHNAQLKWSNSLRNIMLRYIHQVSQRRGFVYYTSRRAVKFILDIVEEQRKSSAPHQASPFEESGSASPQSPLDASDDEDVKARIEELLNDGKQFVNADDTEDSNGNRRSATAYDKNEDVSKDFVAQNTYHVRLVAPQIQLQSEKNPKAVVLVAARGMRLQVFRIMDKDRMSDDVSGLVQTRFSLDMDNLQLFVTSKPSFSPQYLPIYSGNSYGTATGSQWPPWAPMEAMFDFDVKTYGFERVVQRTSASLRYDKYNKLRLKYNDSVTDGKHAPLDSANNPDSRIDNFRVDFPRIRAICDSAQYYAMYIIVLDLLMWSEPLEKTRNERLEKIMLAADFTDLRGAPEMVMTLQDRIRALEEIKTHFHVNETHLDRQGLEDRIAMEQDLATCEDELFFMMKAITTSQRKADDRTDNAQATGILHYHISASEIVWHLIKEANHALAEFQLRQAVFERTDNSDGSNHNSIDIDQVKGLSLLEKTMYPEIITAYNEHAGHKPTQGHSQMLRVKWYQLEAIAGINVVDHFEVNLHPVRIQLDYETGRKLFEYIFPGAGTGDEGFSPLMIRSKLPGLEDEDEYEDGAEAARNRHQAIANATKNNPSGYATGAGSLEQRLQPTHALPDYNKAPTPSRQKTGLGVSLGDQLRPKFFQRSSSTMSVASTKQSKTLIARASADSLGGGKSGRGRNGAGTPNPENSNNHRKRFHMGSTKHRSTSADSRASKATANARSDDLTQMLDRASNYMTLAYVRVPSVVLCLSYKGKGHRNFEDVHNLVFRMPTLEYRNKTWSNLDLAMQLKKDVTRALISHTGAILNNKISKHKYGKSQQNRLREIASSSVVLSSNDISRVPSAASSVNNLGNLRGRNSNSDDSYAQPRASDATSDFAFNDSVRRTDTLGSELSDFDEHELDGSDPSRSEDMSAAPSIYGSDAPNRPPPEQETGVRASMARQFSQLTQKAASTVLAVGEGGGGGVFNGHGHGHGHADARVGRGGVDEEEAVPETKRSRLVKKLLKPLEKDEK